MLSSYHILQRVNIIISVDTGTKNEQRLPPAYIYKILFGARSLQVWMNLLGILSSQRWFASWGKNCTTHTLALSNPSTFSQLFSLLAVAFITIQHTPYLHGTQKVLCYLLLWLYINIHFDYLHVVVSKPWSESTTSWYLVTTKG